MIYVYAALVLFVILAPVLRYYYVRGQIANHWLGGTDSMASKEELQKEWYDLSWSGTDPIRVIRLAGDLAFSKDKYEQAKFLSSSFYSQVKYLVRKHWSPIMALAFFQESRHFARVALAAAEDLPKGTVKPIDLEVLGATDFMLAKMPAIGLLFKKRALTFLDRASSELSLKENGSIDAALIWSKMYALTKDEARRGSVRYAGLNRKMDHNQLTRISKHLGFDGSVDRLLEWCGERS